MAQRQTVRTWAERLFSLLLLLSVVLLWVFPQNLWVCCFGADEGREQEEPPDLFQVSWPEFDSSELCQWPLLQRASTWLAVVRDSLQKNFSLRKVSFNGKRAGPRSEPATGSETGGLRDYSGSVQPSPQSSGPCEPPRCVTWIPLRSAVVAARFASRIPQISKGVWWRTVIGEGNTQRHSRCSLPRARASTWTRRL